MKPEDTGIRGIPQVKEREQTSGLRFLIATRAIRKGYGGSGAPETKGSRLLGSVKAQSPFTTSIPGLVRRCFEMDELGCAWAEDCGAAPTRVASTGARHIRAFQSCESSDVAAGGWETGFSYLQNYLAHLEGCLMAWVVEWHRLTSVHEIRKRYKLTNLLEKRDCRIEKRGHQSSAAALRAADGHQLSRGHKPTHTGEAAAQD